MLDSPFDFCRVCRAYVLLDQTQQECAREHRCADAATCPLRTIFAGIDFAGAHSAATSPGTPERNVASARRRSPPRRGRG